MLSLCGQPVTGKVNKVRKNCLEKKEKVSLMTMLKNLTNECKIWSNIEKQSKKLTVPENWDSPMR